MLFSRAEKFRKNKKIVTLQVRILKKQKTGNTPDGRGKRAFLSAPAALTLEAAMCLTLFIFASVCLILPMKIMNTERMVQASLEELGEDFSKYAYVENALENNKIFAVSGAGDFAKEFCRHLVSGAARVYAQAQVMERIDTDAVRKVNLLRAQVLEDGETIDLILDYEIRLPFPVLGLPALQRTARCCRRAWIGKPGKDYSGNGGQAGKEEDSVVYVGKNSTRYHKSRSCHYLANNLKAVSKAQAAELRNGSGGKYHPCAVCGGSAGDTVYIMPNGSSYHSGKYCSAIVAYARAVRMSEAEHLGACSYCGK